MTHLIHFRPEASEEFLDACEWYERREAGLGDEFERCIEGKLLSIAERPDLCPLTDRDIREAHVGRFPYTIYFRVGESGIRVLPVFHNSRDPDVWQSRWEE